MPVFEGLPFHADHPVCRHRASLRLGALDVELHDEPTPSLGGLAILAGMLVPALLFLPLFGDPESRSGRAGSSLGAVVVALVGTADDVWDLRARQVPAAVGRR